MSRHTSAITSSSASSSSSSSSGRVISGEDEEEDEISTNNVNVNNAQPIVNRKEDEVCVSTTDTSDNDNEKSKTTNASNTDTAKQDTNNTINNNNKPAEVTTEKEKGGKSALKQAQPTPRLINLDLLSCRFVSSYNRVHGPELARVGGSVTALIQNRTTMTLKETQVITRNLSASVDSMKELLSRKSSGQPDLWRSSLFKLKV